MKKNALILLLLLAITAISVTPAFAAGGKIRFGNLAIVPSMGIIEIHDDNIYYDRHNKQSAWITHFRPGLALDYTIEGRGKFGLGYKGDYAYFSQQNNNNWKDHSFFTALDYRSPGGLIVRMWNKLSNTSTIFASKDDYETGRQSEFWADALESAIGFKFSERFKAFAFYNFHRQDYKNNGGGRYSNVSFYSGYNDPDYYYRGSGDWREDYYSNEVGLGIETKISHKTWAFLRYYTGAHNYFTHRSGITDSNDSSYDWQQVASGLTWDDGGRLGGELNLGYQWNDHDNKHDQFGGRYKDKNLWTAATRFHFKETQSRKWSINLHRKHHMADSGTSRFFVMTSMGLQVEQKFKSKYFFRLGYFYAIHRYTAEGSSSYNSTYNYFTSRSKDTSHRILTSLRYEMKEWLSAGLDYTYWKSHADTSYGGFSKNQFALSLEFKPASYH